MQVFGYESDRGRIPGQTEFLRDGETFKWGKSEVRALHIPGHTSARLPTWSATRSSPVTPCSWQDAAAYSKARRPMMHHSLNDVLVPLGPGRRVFCGHEYTVSNLMFCRFGGAGQRRGERAPRESSRCSRARRAHGRLRWPKSSTTNPFLRCKIPAIRASMKLDKSASEIEVFAAIRKAKDSYRAPR